MSNQNINISAKNIAGNCELKCSYTFKYSESNSTAKNNGVMISLTYDSTSVPPVIYNNQQYTVGNISIVSPSIHTFNNVTMPGEIIITHNPVKGGNILEVCIPFVSSVDSSTASQMITEIISKVSTNAPSDGDSTNLNISGFSLEYIVPKKPFFSYTENTTDYIVFGDINAIPLSSSTISTLQQIITPYQLSTPGGDLFYNSKGPTSGIQLDDGIYISCQPTGSSNEEMPVEYDKNPSSAIDFSNIFNSPIYKTIILIIIVFIVFMIIFFGISKFFTYLNAEPTKLFNVKV